MVKANELLEGFTIDTPVPYRLADLVKSFGRQKRQAIERARRNTVSGPKKGQPKTEKGPLNGKLSRFLIRLKTKMNDRRYAFMYQAPEEYETYEALHDLAKSCLAQATSIGGVNPGIKIIDFSECPRTFCRWWWAWSGG